MANREGNTGDTNESNSSQVLSINLLNSKALKDAKYTAEL